MIFIDLVEEVDTVTAVERGGFWSEYCHIIRALDDLCSKLPKNPNWLHNWTCLLCALLVGSQWSRRVFLCLHGWVFRQFHCPVHVVS